MKAARWVPFSLLVIAAAACTVGAETPPTNGPGTEPAQETVVVATSIPGSGLPTVVLPTATSSVARATATAVPRTSPTSVAVSTTPPAEATSPVSFDPTATPVVTPAAQPTASIVSAPGEPYRPVLSHSFTLPAGWQKLYTADSTVLTDPSGAITITVRETPVERWRYPAASVLGATLFPERPASWSQWSLTSSGPIKAGEAYEFQFVGSKQGVGYLNFIQWYLWGDILVEVNTEAPSAEWASAVSVRNQVQSVTEGFVPHTGGSLMTMAQVLEILRVRLDGRPSGIYGRDEVARARVELTCRDIYEALLTEPQYIDKGMWQAVGYTPEGAETWWVFEPHGSVMAVNSNRSRC